jgi:hypothetical protein
VLDQVQESAAVGRVVESRDVPEVEVEDPEREGDKRMGEDPQPVEDRDREDRLQQRPGQAEDQQQGRDVAQHQVLDHVGDHQLLADVGNRRDEGDGDRQQPAGEAELAPERHRPPFRGQGQRALRVQAGREQQRQQLERGERPFDVGQRRMHRFQRSPLLAWQRP